ncbi:MAG TPA: hypothetical protein VFE32_15240 [Puia sp.]|jgi:hypothetical protein|nr:hypothetical protein [Puia sp.]
MEVTINNEEYHWVSDYDDGWMRSSGDDFKFPIMVGERHFCFVKRFARDAAGVSGWRLVQALRANNQPGLARVLDIVQTEESGIPVRYLFCEFMKGDTLDDKSKKEYTPNTRRLLWDLFKALRSMHRLEHWMSDFCEKNIFCKSDDAYCLIDLDSAHPMTARPDNKMYGNKDYWSGALTYLSHQAGLVELRPEDVAGPILNYLQVALLMVRVRVALVLKEESYQSATLKERLPELLDQAVPEFRELFAELVRRGADVPTEEDIEQIKELLLARVVNGEGNGRRREEAGGRRNEENGGRGQEVNGGRRHEGDATQRLPSVGRFSSDKRRLLKGGAFTLSWEVDNGEKIVVYRNGVAFKEAAKGLGAMTLTERYDGKERTVDYSLEVTNAMGEARSEPLSIHIGMKWAIPWKLALLAVGGLAAVVILVLAMILLVREVRKHSQQKIAGVDSVQPDTAKKVKVYDPYKRYEDSLNHVRDSIARVRLADTQVVIKKPPKTPPKRTNNTTGKFPPPKTDTIKHITDVVKPPPVRDTAEERRTAERKVKDSVRIVDTVIGRKILGVIKRKGQNELRIHNLSGSRLETVKVLIIPNGGGMSYEKEIHNVPPRGYSMLLDNVPNGGVKTSIISVNIKLP